MLDMIQSHHSTFSVLAYDSLYGFVFTLNLNGHPEDAEYIDRVDSRFNTPVVNYILKFAILRHTTGLTLPPLQVGPRQMSKNSEKEERFFREAQIQQKIWLKSISGGRPAICPPIVNFSLFHQTEALELLSLISRRFSSSLNLETHEVLHYLWDVLDNYPTSLGVIVMPMISGATTLYSFEHNPHTTLEDKNEVLAQLTAKTLRLFLDIGMIHLDLHRGNALVYRTPGGTLNTVIIDFGRASDITTGVSDDFIHESQKAMVSSEKTQFFDFLLSKEPKGPGYKKVFVQSEMQALKEQDLIYNSPLDPNNYQMGWFEQIKNNDDVLIRAYDLLYDSVISKGTQMLPSTIKAYKQKGLLFNLDRPVATYYSSVLTAPPPVPLTAPATHVAPLPPPPPLGYSTPQSKSYKTPRESSDQSPRQKRKHPSSPKNTIYHTAISTKGGGVKKRNTRRRHQQQGKQTRTRRP